MRKKIAMCMTAFLIAASMAGCGTAKTTDSAGTTTTSGEMSGSETTDGKTEVLLWHSMSGSLTDKLMKIVDGFNASQDKVVVVAESQGTYDESTSKFFNMNGGSGSPAILQIGEQNLQSVMDSGLVASVSDLMKQYGFDDSKLLVQAKEFYSVDGNMYAMPFNISSPVLFYNVEALKKAGVEEVPSTYQGITEIADKVSEANNGMKIFSKPVYGYALDQMVTMMGGYIVNNDNGRSARATEVAYQPEVLEIFKWLSDLVAADQLLNSKQTKATAGPLVPLLPQLRSDLQTAEEMVFNGGDPQKALDTAVASTNKQIETANKSIQK